MRLYTALLLAFLVVNIPVEAQLKQKADSLHNLLSLKAPKESFILPQKTKADTMLEYSFLREWRNGQWENRKQYNYTYSGDFKEDTVLELIYQDNKWINGVRTVTRYDDLKNITWRSIEYYYNNTWEYDQQIFITYGAFGAIEEIRQVWYNGWQNSARYTSVYDDSGREKELLVEQWKGAWENLYRYITEYDDTNNTSELIEQYWNNEWKNQFRLTTRHNDDNSVLFVHYQWELENWKPAEKHLYLYDDEDKVQEITVYQWNTTDWKYYTRNNFVYEEVSRLRTEIILQTWNSNDSMWTNTNKEDYEYSNGILTLVTTFAWTNNKWINLYKNIYEDLGLVKNNIWQYWWEEQWNNERLISYHYKLITSVKGTSIVSAYKLEQNFPNPFNAITNFEFRIADFEMAELKLFDLLGREVAVIVNKEMYPGIYIIQFDAGRLASGVYYYQLKAGNFIETKKMILMK